MIGLRFGVPVQQKKPEISATKSGHVVVKRYLPVAPKGVPNERWQNCQLALKAAGVPNNILGRISTLRQMNMWVAMVIIREHPWQQIADWEVELMKKHKPKPKEK